MLYVGQCEACEGWYLEDLLVEGEITRPTLAARQHELETGTGIPGLGEVDRRAYFCRVCVRAMRDPDHGAPAETNGCETEDEAVVEGSDRGRLGGQR